MARPGAATAALVTPVLQDVRIFRSHHRTCGECQEVFLDGHLRAFEYFDGYPEQIRSDNFKGAVERVVRGPGRGRVGPPSSDVLSVGVPGRSTTLKDPCFQGFLAAAGCFALRSSGRAAVNRCRQLCGLIGRRPSRRRPLAFPEPCRSIGFGNSHRCFPIPATA
jgi:hypothetical protein